MSARKSQRKSEETSARPGLRPRQRRSFTEQAYREIRRQILDNEMPAGFQITEQDLALRLRMSRTPTREALVHLAGEGLIEIWPRHGMRVKHVSVADLREIHHILGALEVAAARLAARRKLPADQARALRRSVADMERTAEAGDMRAWVVADTDFHRALAEASGNRRLADTAATYWNQVHRLRMITLRMREKPTASNRDHQAVVEAILKGDSDTAARLHREHWDWSGEMLIDLLEKHGIHSL
jgi:DNA-binding GntR family transcriptional regulator